MQSSFSKPFSYRADAQVPAFADDHPILVFDGKCVLCSGFVQFLLRHDRRAVFRFASAQSALGTALYRHYGLDATHYESNLLLVDGLLYLKSSGSLRIFKMLGFPFALLAIGWALPRAARDWLYDVIASHRLQWFGSHEQCMLPDPRFVDRFLG